MLLTPTRNRTGANMNLKKLDECRQAFTAAEAAAYDSLGNVINAAALQDFSRASDALADANFNAPAKADATGRQWRLAGFAAHAELWRADDAKLMAHGWAVCDPGDEPDHATWSTTTTEAIARQWFAQRVPFF
jgi:hypothetical protein